MLIIPPGNTGGTAYFGDYFGDGKGPSLCGQLMAVQLQFGAGTMAGGTATLATDGQGAVPLTLLSYIGGTSQWFAPRQASQNVSGVNLGTTIVDRIPVDDRVSLVCSGVSAGTITSRALFWTDR